MINVLRQALVPEAHTSGLVARQGARQAEALETDGATEPFPRLGNGASPLNLILSWLGGWLRAIFLGAKHVPFALTLCHARRFVGADSGPALQTGGRGCWCCKAWARSFHSWNGFAQVQTSRQSKSNTMQNFGGRFESMPLSKTTKARTRFDAEIIQQRAFLSQGKAQLRRSSKFACVP